MNLIGSNHAKRRECDTEVFRRAGLVVVDDLGTARIECGDMMPAVDQGILRWEDAVELGRIVVGDHPGRRSPSEITVFESHGIAAEDVSAAARCYSLAKSKGRGETVAFLD